MHIYVIQRESEALWFVKATYQPSETYNWSQALNTNYIDDIRQINELARAYPARVDMYGTWLYDPLETFIREVRAWISAITSSTVQMGVSMANLRAMAAFDRCCLPRDVRGVIRSFACADNDPAMMRRLFDRYVELKHVIGMDMYAFNENMHSPQINVVGVEVNGDRYCLSINQPRWCTFEIYYYAPDDRAPYFIMHMYDVNLHFVGLHSTEGQAGVIHMLTVQFRTADEVSFTCKRTCKRLPCG